MNTAKQPFLLLISGSVGAGKSTVGEALKKKIARTAVFDMDVIKWQISDFARGDGDNAIVRDAVQRLARTYCKHGLSVVIPQTIRPEEPAQFRQIAKETDHAFLQLELFTDDETAYKRVMVNQASSAHPTTEARVRRNIAWYHKNKTTDPHIKCIDTSRLRPEEALSKIVQEMEAHKLV